jgi:hypothetical protein
LYLGKGKNHITLTTVTFLRFVMFTLWNYYVLKLLRSETITFSDATLSDINVVLCYVLSQYRSTVTFYFQQQTCEIHTR